MTSISTPVRSRTASMSAALLGAIRMPAVPTAAIASAPSRRASSTMPTIGVDRARDRLARRAARCRARPSPRRVTSARSTIVRQAPFAARSPTWNFTEFVPTSMTA